MESAQKDLQHFLYLSQNQEEMSIIFVWLLLNVPLAIAKLWNNTLSHTITGHHQNGAEWRCAF